MKRADPYGVLLDVVSDRLAESRPRGPQLGTVTAIEPDFIVTLDTGEVLVNPVVLDPV